MVARRRRTESEPVRREQLLGAARKVFKEKGYDGSTITDIVREAGVAQGTFYLYYASKSAIAVALRDGLMKRMSVAVESAMKPNTSFEERLKGLISTSFGVARQNADLYRLAFIGADDTHQELHTESSEHASILTVVTDLFTGAFDDGEMETKDPEIAARLAIGLIQHAIIEAFVFGEGEESDRLESSVGDLLATGLVKRV